MLHCNVVSHWLGADPKHPWSGGHICTHHRGIIEILCLGLRMMSAIATTFIPLSTFYFFYFVLNVARANLEVGCVMLLANKFFNVISVKCPYDSRTP